MPNKAISDILAEAGKCKSRKKKIIVLQKNASPTLKMVLSLTYDPNVIWLLPEGPPPKSYKPNAKEADMEGQFYATITLRLIYNCIQGQASPDLQQWKREKIFIDLLETLDPDDAQVVVQMKDRKLKYNGITRALVCDAFPGMTQKWNQAE